LKFVVDKRILRECDLQSFGDSDQVEQERETIEKGGA
jgi:hypothetical protein